MRPPKKLDVLEHLRMGQLAVLLLLVLFTTLPAVGQVGGGRIPDAANPRNDLHTPERGSDERKAIMDALRVPVEKKLHQQVIFKADHLKVQSDWAFLIGKPQRLDGTPVDYSGTVYKDAVDAGAFDDGIVALLHEVSGKWRVVQFVIGATDVPFVDWDKKYHAPKAIFEQ
jgi:hypothetical protein